MGEKQGKENSRLQPISPEEFEELIVCAQLRHRLASKYGPSQLRELQVARCKRSDAITEALKSLLHQDTKEQEAQELVHFAKVKQLKEQFGELLDDLDDMYHALGDIKETDDDHQKALEQKMGRWKHAFPQLISWVQENSPKLAKMARLEERLGALELTNRSLTQQLLSLRQQQQQLQHTIPAMPWESVSDAPTAVQHVQQGLGGGVEVPRQQLAQGGPCVPQADVNRLQLQQTQEKLVLSEEKAASHEKRADQLAAEVAQLQSQLKKLELELADSKAEADSSMKSEDTLRILAELKAGGFKPSAESAKRQLDAVVRILNKGHIVKDVQCIKQAAGLLADYLATADASKLRFLKVAAQATFMPYEAPKQAAAGSKASSSARPRDTSAALCLDGVKKWLGHVRLGHFVWAYYHTCSRPEVWSMVTDYAGKAGTTPASEEYRQRFKGRQNVTKDELIEFLLQHEQFDLVPPSDPVQEKKPAKQ